MTSQTTRLTAARGHLAVCAGLLLLATVAGAQAQTVYRIVGPDGKVSFSDRPPVSADSKATNAKTGATIVQNNPPLPYELQQVVSKFPVILYSAPNCSPCSSSRALLVQRGVPFTERTIVTEQDSNALQQISGDTTLPFATIGRQQLKGFSDVEWAQYLDAAGYTGSAKLPSGYRNPEPSPLVAVAKAPTAAANADAAAAPEGTAAPRGRNQRGSTNGATPSANTNSNPAGIRF